MWSSSLWQAERPIIATKKNRPNQPFHTQSEIHFDGCLIVGEMVWSIIIIIIFLVKKNFLKFVKN